MICAIHLTVIDFFDWLVAANTIMNREIMITLNDLGDPLNISILKMIQFELLHTYFLF